MTFYKIDGYVKVYIIRNTSSGHKKEWWTQKWKIVVSGFSSPTML